MKTWIKRKDIPDWTKKNIPERPPIVIAVDGHNGNFAETENEPKNETRHKKSSERIS